MATDVRMDMWLPKVIQLQSPPDRSLVGTSNPTLEWATIAEAVSYTIQINESVTWNLLEVGRSPTTTYVVQNALTPGVEYTWQVDARDALDIGPLAEGVENVDYVNSWNPG